MKTQISNLRSGQKGQFLNSEIDYSGLPLATSHVGHCGTNQNIVEEVWGKVILENEKTMKIVFLGETIELTANWSLSRKSVSYFATVSKELAKKVGLTIAKKEDPYIHIGFGNVIKFSNGKNDYINVCPSLIEII
jgi:hypothetical protein